jgi:hypothetical protein
MNAAHDGQHQSADVGSGVAPSFAEGDKAAAALGEIVQDVVQIPRFSEPERVRWVSAAGMARAKDAWELFKGKQEQRADDLLADAHAGLLWAIAELRAAGIAVPISLHQACTR